MLAMSRRSADGSRTCFLPVPVFLLLLLAGCITPPTPEQLTSADYGTLPPAYRKIIKEHMEGVLFDPYSAHYRLVEEPQKGYAYVLGRTKPPVFGYLVFVGIDAKSAWGKYVGEKPFRFLFKDDLYWMLSERTKAEVVR